MKEAEISQLAPSASRASGRPRYRYNTNPPTTVSLRLADLAAQIPDAARLPGFNGQHTVELSCEEIFRGLTPKLPLSRLAEIAGEHVRIDGLSDQSIQLPVARLALAFRFINGRELIEEPPPPEERRPEKSPEEFAPKSAETAAPQTQKPAGDAGITSAPLSDGTASSEEKERSIASAVSANSPPPAPLSASDKDKSLPVEAEVSSAVPTSPNAPLAQPASSAPSALNDSTTEQEKAEAPEEWRPLPLFPIFRRKPSEPQVKPPVAPLRPVVEPPPPRSLSAPPEVSAKPEQETKAEPTEEAAKESVSRPVQAEAVLVKDERLPETKRAVEIVDHDTLQALFMTEEMLSVDRVIELCGGLPGIKSCVLAQGPAVIASHNVSDSIDLVSLSAHALEMLAAMRQSAARMGVGAVPAVTIHAEKGPITFFHRDDLCLLVMHKDRGFVPGVREKLQNVVEHLAQSCPELAEGATRLAGGPRKPTG